MYPIGNASSKNWFNCFAFTGISYPNNKCVNKRIPDRTKAEYQTEYRLKNKDKLAERDIKYQSNYYQKNKDTILTKLAANRASKKEQNLLIS